MFPGRLEVSVPVKSGEAEAKAEANSDSLEAAFARKDSVSVYSIDSGIPGFLQGPVLCCNALEKVNTHGSY